MSHSNVTGQMISRYRLRGKLGSGGMGVVYEAEDTTLGRRVALKFLPPELSRDHQAVVRFQREARVASSLNHPHICIVHDVGEHEGQQFIVMELLEGTTLNTLLTAEPLKMDRLLELATQIADALDVAHYKGIVHRDIKPSNIFITRRGEAKILDFGLAKLAAQRRAGANAVDSTGVPTVAAGESLTRPGIPMGTIGYMSPEQARGEELDERTDLFSFGAVLYEMATGQQPFRGNTSAVIFAALLDQMPEPPSFLNPDLPPELERIIYKALEKDSQLRYQTAADLLADLKRLRRNSDPRYESARGWVPASVGPTSRDRSIPAVTPPGHATPALATIRRAANYWKLIVAIALVMIAVAAATLWLRNRNVPSLTDRDSILLAEFVNTTGESVFDGTLKQGLAAHLEQSPFLNIFPEARMRETLRYMGRSPDERVTSEVAREICERQGIKAMLMGSISILGSQYVISLDALNCQNGESLAREQTQAESKEQVLSALGKVASKIRERLGESLSSIEKFDAPIEQVTTSSLEGLRAFSLGEAQLARGSGVDAAPHYKRACELDQNFALAYGRLSAIYSNIGEFQRAREYMTQAFERRGRVSEREKLYISSRYYDTVTGEVGKAMETYRLWSQTYPRDLVPRNNLAYAYTIVGQFDKAVEEAREALSLNPNHPFPYGNLGFAFLGLNRFDEAKAVFDQAVQRKIDDIAVRVGLYEIAFVRGDTAGMERHSKWATGKRREEWMLFTQAQSAACSGGLRKAREISQRALDLALRGNFKEFAALIVARQALVEAEFGNDSQARERATAAMQIAESRDCMLVTAAALSLAGDIQQARRLIDKLAQRFSTDTLASAVWLPTARSAIEIHSNNPTKALQHLESAIPYELGRMTRFFASLSSLYARGQAYLRLKSGEKAAAEFKTILDHRGVAPVSELYALAHLGLARAAALAGNLDHSRRTYQDFLALWKDADPDIPILQDAKREYAKLR